MLFNGIEYETDDLKRLMALGDHNTASMLFDAWPKPDDGFEALALAALGEPASWMGADADEWLRAAGAACGRTGRVGMRRTASGVRAQRRPPPHPDERGGAGMAGRTLVGLRPMDDDGERARLAGILHEATERRLR